MQTEERENKLQLFWKGTRHRKNITRCNQSWRSEPVIINQWPAYDTQSYHQKHISNLYSTSQRCTLHRLPSAAHWYEWILLNNATLHHRLFPGVSDRTVLYSLQTLWKSSANLNYEIKSQLRQVKNYEKVLNMS